MVSKYKPLKEAQGLTDQNPVAITLHLSLYSWVQKQISKGKSKTHHGEHFVSLEILYISSAVTPNITFSNCYCVSLSASWNTMDKFIYHIGFSWYCYGEAWNITFYKTNQMDQMKYFVNMLNIFSLFKKFIYFQYFYHYHYVIPVSYTHLKITKIFIN